MQLGGSLDAGARSDAAGRSALSHASPGQGLHGLRVLVVEDTFLIADLIVETLREQGCSVVGPAARLQQGLALVEGQPLDGALLDVNLAGELCYPIADALAHRGVPFVFLSGYGDAGIPPEYRQVPRLTKPFTLAELVALAGRHFRAGG